MRIGELAHESGVAVPTIKYYLRAGLLTSGAITARNQALYDETHLRRLRVIRVMIGIGGLSVESAKAILDAAADPRVPVRHLLDMLEPVRTPVRQSAAHQRVREAARHDVAGLLGSSDWPLRVQAPALESMTDICAAARLLELGDLCGVLEDYAKAAVHLAECEAQLVEALAERLRPMADERRVLWRESLVVSAVLGGALKAVVHRAASTHALSCVAAPALGDASTHAGPSAPAHR